VISLPWVIINIPNHFLLTRGVAMNILEAALLSNTTSAARLSEPNEQANRHAHPSALFTFAVSPSSATCNGQASCTKSMAMAWVLQRLLLQVGSTPSLVVTPQFLPFDFSLYCDQLHYLAAWAGWVAAGDLPGNAAAASNSWCCDRIRIKERRKKRV